ncbi:MAG: hypothetical protein LQ348_002132 [Seirophora lacunosa]|nr:MAG: hypothetical protein LQ348_002132 [Seirophora lacunosa]
MARDPNFDWWQRQIGTPLAILLHKAGYDLETQYAYIRFFLDCTIPALGPSHGMSSDASPWQSFMTDDHTPVELSWEWRHTGENPDVRYSIEPIGHSAGGRADPFNLLATPCLIGQLQRTISSLDLRWYSHFAETLLPNAPALGSQYGALLGQSPAELLSTSFVAYDLRRKGPVTVKAYFLPSIRAMQSEVSNFNLIIRAIRSLPESRAGAFQALRLLIEYTETDALGSELECEMLGIDCVSADSARLKIYLRSGRTSFDSVRSIMTLGGRVQSPEDDDEDAFGDLFELWNALFFPEKQASTTATTSTELRRCGHRTAGILYYFDFSKSHAKPVPKVYLPVRHYGESDHLIAKAVCARMKRKGKQHEARQYLSALEEIL